MLVGYSFVTVFEHERDMQGISGAPYPSFAIYKAFQPFLYILATDIETTYGLFFTIGYSYIGLLFSGFRYYDERHSFRVNNGKPVLFGFCFTYRLQLKAISGYFGFLYRSCVEYIVDCYP